MNPSGQALLVAHVDDTDNEAAVRAKQERRLAAQVEAEKQKREHERKKRR